MGFLDKFRSGLRKTREQVFSQLEAMVSGRVHIDEEFYEELEEQLLLADVGLPMTTLILARLKQKIRESNLADPAGVMMLLREVVTALLHQESSGGIALNHQPTVILAVGVNGVGKTTTLGKLSRRYANEGKRVVLVAGDTFRAAATEQLGIWAQRTGAELVHQQEGADPAAVVYDALARAKVKKADVILIDTAGRLHNKKNLMNELEKIVRVIRREIPDAPHETLMVLDAQTGQNGIAQAKQFKEIAALTGLVLTKLDGTAKGGVVLAIQHEVGLPVKLIGLGEKEDDLLDFDAAYFAEGLFANNA